MSNSTFPTTVELDTIVQEIFVARPILRKLAEYCHLHQYFAPAVEWNPSSDAFSQRPVLKKVIIAEAGRLYGQKTTVDLEAELDKRWSVETGAHVHLPKRYDRLSKREGPQINPLVFQGQITWAAVNRQARKNSLNLSLSSSRVPINNANSACYLDYSISAEPLRLISNRYKETPQTFIPALTVAQLQAKREQLSALLNSKKVGEQELEFAQSILDVMSQHSTKAGLPDQAVTAHAAMINRTLPPDLTQVTLDSEEIGRQFLIALLGDPDSVLYQTLVNEQRYLKLRQTLQGIATGWKNEEGMFYQVDRSQSEPRFKEYAGSINPEELQVGLTQGTIWAKGLLKFFVFMVEAGLCPIGGMNQSMYCTQLRDRSAAYLQQELNDSTRAELLSSMPTDIATITPCWGIAQHEQAAELISALDCIYQPLTNTELDRIAELSGFSSLELAAPSLCKLLLNKESPVSYEDLRQMLRAEIINR